MNRGPRYIYIYIRFFDPNHVTIFFSGLASSWVIRFVLVFILKDIYNLISIKQCRYASLGLKNLQKQYGRRHVGLERTRKFRED
ncbi:hypothetical protein DKX38_008596 [Salix brachista]|uniref:Uncharacterized protein n=1 Tax=Salix brachista TaxID=2182728 RepID=A0A5N5MRP4_9ROSI|nr:hypothetical protein DKX38_008596 [Salix brachista]